MSNDASGPAGPPETVPATLKLISMLSDQFDLLENFHPAYAESLTIVDRETRSAVTLVVVESFEM